MIRKNLRFAAPAALLTLALGLSACGAANESDSGSDAPAGGGVSGTLNAGGSSAQEAAVAAWKSAFQTANPDVTVNYDPVGSGGGREQFIAGGLAIAGSDAYLDDDELAAATAKCGSDIVEVPVYVSPIAVIFNLKGVKELNLSASTIADIFSGKITTWDDAAIKADNADADLPSTKITPVHRSDDSGTTQNFTDYLFQASEGAWTDEAAQTWPIKSGEAAEGTSGVVAAVTAGEGAIGYADESQAGELGQAKIKVGDTFNAATPEAAAKVLDTSKAVEGRAATDIAIDIDRTSTEAGVYPIVLASYQIACLNPAKDAELVKAWLTYVASSDGQKVAGDAAGSAPLTADFGAKVQAAVEKIAAA